MKLNRRAFLTGVSAIAIAPAVKFVPAIEAAPIGMSVLDVIEPYQKLNSMMIRQIIDRALNEEFHGAYTQTDEQWRRIFAEVQP